MDHHLLVPIAAVNWTFRSVRVVLSPAVAVQETHPLFGDPYSVRHLDGYNSDTVDYALGIDAFNGEQAGRQPNWFALFFLPLLSVLGFIGNLMVCVAIYTDRRLHNVTNYFLFSLAVADLLVCALVMPLSIIVEVRNGIWAWSFSLCVLYVYSDVFLCSASIVHMSIISLDRYMGISRPLKTRNKSRTMIIIKIIIVWVITVIISSPMAALALHNESNVLQDDSCAITNRYFMIYGSTLSFLIPFVVMAVTYVKTTRLLTQQAALLSQKTNGSEQAEGLRRSIPAQRKVVQSCANSTNSLRLKKHSYGQGTHVTGNASSSPTPKMSVCKQSVQFASIDLGNVASTMTLCSMDNVEKQLIEQKKLKWTRQRSDESQGKTKLERLRNRTTNALTMLASKVHRRGSFQTASQELANEHKATRVLAVVFICFFICWTPFFGMNFTLGFCGQVCDVPPAVASTFLWLGYISSTINPVIYTIFNRRFREAFLRILRCQCWHPHRDLQHGLFSRGPNTCVSNGLMLMTALSPHQRKQSTRSGGSITSTVEGNSKRKYTNSKSQLRSAVSTTGTSSTGLTLMQKRGSGQISPDESSAGEADKIEDSLEALHRRLLACEESNHSSSPSQSRAESTGGLYLHPIPPTASQLAVKRHSHGMYIRNPTIEVHSTSNNNNNNNNDVIRRGPYAKTGLMPKSPSAGHVMTMNRRKSSTETISTASNTPSKVDLSNSGKVSPVTTTDLTLYLAPHTNQPSSTDQMAYIAGHVLTDNACKETFV